MIDKIGFFNENPILLFLDEIVVFLLFQTFEKLESRHFKNNR